MMGLLPALAAAAVADTIDCDLCIYGGTSGGVAAAVQATRMGRSAVLLEPGAHLGGMTSGGLGRTDTGNTAAIGGIGDEFYLAIGSRYGGGRQYTFEPHVAEEVFEDWIAAAGVPVYFGSRVESVDKQGARIVSLSTANGHLVRARMFIDASYEGDLMALAGVSYTVGREANSQYGETLNGVRPDTPKHQFVVDVDPYVVPGNPASGLLPHIQPGDGGTPGAGDAGVQAYNYRLCLTQDPANRLPIEAPPGYDPARYELLGRYILARLAAGHSLTLGSFLKIDAMPNGKTDINNQGAFSTDFIGGNYGYPDGTPAQRAAIADETLGYIQGLLHFLGHDARVPATVRSEMLGWGRCRDEFQDTGGWPHQMYVREARRMVSDLVMNEAHCRGLRVAAHPVGLGAYTMDSHNVQRVVQGGVVRNEGDVQVGVPGPYPIGYGAIVPRQAECENLFVTFCLSATHIAFGSIRMEPVLMVLSQSAATAAATAIAAGAPVQQVDRGQLRLQLLADGQVLTWGAGAVDPGDGAMADSEDASAEVAGAWTASSAVTGFAGTNYLHDGNEGKGGKSVTLRPSLAAAGRHDVYLRWTANANRASNVPVTIFHDAGSSTLTVDQRSNGSAWFKLGTWPFLADESAALQIGTTGTDGFVVADAALWVPEGQAPGGPVRVHVIAADPAATEGADSDTARIVVGRTGDAAAALEVALGVGGTATPGADFAPLPAVVSLAAGEAAKVLVIRPPDDQQPEGDESVRVAALAGADYELAEAAVVEVTLHDAPLDGWRFQHFSAAQLADPAVSGPGADPDGDGESNLGEFFGGGDPWARDRALAASVRRADGGCQLDLARSPAAAGLQVAIEHSADLTYWEQVEPAPPVRLVREAPREFLRFDLGAAGGRAVFWRAVVTLAGGGFVEEAVAFHPFDTLPAGTGGFTLQPAWLAGFQQTPAIVQQGSALAATGGAASFAGPDGNVWLGSGSSGTPGNCLAWNPGSTGNQLVVQLSTLGWKALKVRMDVRSAQQAGGSAPTAFSAFTFEVGAGPQPVPGAALGLGPLGQFSEWSADLSGLTTIEDRAGISLAWAIEPLAASPAESFRIDNLVIEATTAGR